MKKLTLGTQKGIAPFRLSAERINMGEAHQDEVLKPRRANELYNVKYNELYFTYNTLYFPEVF